MLLVNKMKEEGVIKINELSRDIQKEILKGHGIAIRFINNPDKELQIIAAKANGHAIRFINNPDKDVQLEAVKQNGRSIRFINNPDKELQLEAVKKDGRSIRFINNPDKDVQLEAIKENGANISYIKNPDKEVLDRIEIYETSFRTIYAFRDDDGKYKFSLGCQNNISKENFIWRIYNLDGGLEKKPHRQEYLNILKRY